MLREIAMILLAVSLTVLMEFVTLYLLKVRDERLYFSMPINIGTNLLLNSTLSLLYWASDWLYYLVIVIGEIIVVIIEALLYQLIKKDNKNYLYSFIANAVSGVLGSLLSFVIFTFVLIGVAVFIYFLNKRKKK